MLLANKTLRHRLCRQYCHLCPCPCLIAATWLLQGFMIKYTCYSSDGYQVSPYRRNHQHVSCSLLTLPIGTGVEFQSINKKAAYARNIASLLAGQVLKGKCAFFYAELHGPDGWRAHCRTARGSRRHTTPHQVLSAASKAIGSNGSYWWPYRFWNPQGIGRVLLLWLELASCRPCCPAVDSVAC